MKRRAIKVIKSRLEDVEVGDVVNRNPDAEQGWFTVDAISILFNGHLQLADETEQLTVSGGHKDMVGVQLVREVALDDRGVLVSTTTGAVAPMMVAAPTEPVAAPLDPPAPATTQAAKSEPAATAQTTGPIDLAAEAAAAAAVATKMADAPTGPSGRVPGVDLALVASLLEDLDVGEAPVIDTELSDAPMLADPAPRLPANAVAVDGGALPEKPSYKNPVVVPEGTMLPRRSRAA